MTATTTPKPTALDLAATITDGLTKLAEISDRLGLRPVAVSLTANTYGGKRISVQFTGDDLASVDKLGDELDIPVQEGSPTLYDRRGSVDGVEWATYCGVTADDDTPRGGPAVTATQTPAAGERGGSTSPAAGHHPDWDGNRCQNCNAPLPDADPYCDFDTHPAARKASVR